MGVVLDPETIRRHDEACRKGEDFYLDPQTGYSVMTRFFLVKRGTCCSSGCRHCPYGFQAVKKSGGTPKKGDET